MTSHTVLQFGHIYTNIRPIVRR